MISLKNRLPMVDTNEINQEENKKNDALFIIYPTNQKNQNHLDNYTQHFVVIHNEMDCF